MTLEPVAADLLVVYSGRKIQEGKGRGASRMTQRLCGWETREQNKVTDTKWKNSRGINCEEKGWVLLTVRRGWLTV